MLVENIKAEFNQYKNQAEKSDFFLKREEAFAEFEKVGFPTTKNEEWKYTNLKAITENTFTSTCELHSRVKAFIEQSVFAKIHANLLVFVNGTFVTEACKNSETDHSIVIGSLAKERHSHAAIFNKHFAQYAKVEGQSLNALNTALLSDGAFVYVPAAKTVSQPIIILNITDATDMNVLAHPRNLIVLEK
jgi:Fe-S cluster assembly protein SufD